MELVEVPVDSEKAPECFSGTCPEPTVGLCWKVVGAGPCLRRRINVDKTVGKRTVEPEWVHKEMWVDLGEIKH